MCTVLYSKRLGLIAKNRDKTTSTEEEVLQERGTIAVRTKGAQYFSLGINEHGCAFVSTAVNSVPWMRAIQNGESEYARNILMQDVAGLSSPTELISTHLSSVKTIEEWVELLKNANQLWMGYNIILANHSYGLALECYRNQIKIRPLLDRDYLVNHFREIEFGPKSLVDYPSTFARETVCKQSLDNLDRQGYLEQVLQLSDVSPNQNIWRDGLFKTVSSSIIDLKNIGLNYKSKKEQGYSFRKLLKEKNIQNGEYLTNATI